MNYIPYSEQNEFLDFHTNDVCKKNLKAEFK